MTLYERLVAEDIKLHSVLLNGKWIQLTKPKVLWIMDSMMCFKDCNGFKTVVHLSNCLFVSDKPE